MDPATWLLFVALSLAPVPSPGPGILFALTNALAHGPRATILVGVVNGLGIAALAVAVGLGLAALLEASRMAFTALTVIGAACLIWLGVRLWRDRSAFLVSPEARGAAPDVRPLLAKALAISLTNPKAMVALAAIMPPFLDPARPLMLQVVILAGTYAAMCVLNHIGIAFAGGWLRRFLTSPRRATALRRASGGLFVGFGAALGATAGP